jgi:hypothetical protein
VFVLGLRVAGVLEQPQPGQPFPPAWRAVLAAIGGGLALAFAAGWLAFFPPAAYRRWVAGGAMQRPYGAG